MPPKVSGDSVAGVSAESGAVTMPQFSAAAPKRFCHLRFCQGVYNLSMKKGVMLGALLLASVGMAGRMPDNLKPFQKVCVNGML